MPFLRSWLMFSLGPRSSLSSDRTTTNKSCSRGRSRGKSCLCASVVKGRPSLYDKYFSYVLSHFQTDYDALLEPYRAKLLDSIATKKAIKILDVGVGSGLNLALLATRTPNAEVVGLDPNPSMEQYAQQAAKDGSLKTFRFVRGDGTSMPFETNTFDVAIGTCVLCTVPEVQPVLSEIRRVVKPQGRFLFIEHVAAPVGSNRRLVQTLLNPFHQMFVGGCRLTRETLPSINSSGFKSVKAQSISIEEASIYAPHIVGSAFV